MEFKVFGIYSCISNIERMNQGFVIGTKQFGLMVILISIILAYVIFSFTTELEKVNEEGCTCSDELGYCPHREANVPISTSIGAALVIVLITLGVFMILRGKQSDRLMSEKKKEWEQTLRALDGDEKKIYGIISDSNGVVFQSDIVEKTDFPKTKVSRILDRLEARDIIERRRRGMSNVIILKK